jgi:dephospho-CoA kinase
MDVTSVATIGDNVRKEPGSEAVAARVVIGLTGNIASGKSAVTRLLAELGADVVDADAVAHEALGPGTEETALVAERFGSGVIGADGAVDRPALGRVVFADPQALADLEAIVHPGVRRRVYDRLERSEADVAVLEAIKLLEGPLVDHVDTVWVVAAPREVRIDRLVRERGMTPEDAAQRVDAQNPEEEKIRRADVVIHNGGSLDELQAQVLAAWRALTERIGTGASGDRESG